MKRLIFACVALAMTSLTTVSGAWGASTIYLCLTEKAGAAKSGGVEGKCPAPTKIAAYTRVALPKEESEQQTLLSILRHVKYVASGVGGKPTIQISGVNVQLVNGEGKTASINGEGNLIIGYDENAGKHEQSGSHNMILGQEQTFTSYGGFAAGLVNKISSPFASVSGGDGNVASGFAAAISGGSENQAANSSASVSGGTENAATGEEAWASGGCCNAASGRLSSISGGGPGTASGEGSSISGGRENVAKGTNSWVGGGEENTAEGSVASISGGRNNLAASGYAWIGGGLENTIFSSGKPGAEGRYAAIFGGDGNFTNLNFDAIP